VRRTDSSLIEEWELLVSGPEERPDREPEERPRSIADDPRAFTARVRNELHVLLKSLADRDYQTAATLIRQTDENEWTAERFEAEIAPYFEEHAGIDITPRARQARNTVLFEESDRVWSARQKIIDPEGNDDWTIYCIVDINKPREESDPLIELDRIGL
jgi:hypothetical protein